MSTGAQKEVGETGSQTSEDKKAAAVIPARSPLLRNVSLGGRQGGEPRTNYSYRDTSGGCVCVCVCV